MDEKALVGTLFASLPVLRHSLPPDIRKLVEMLRKAFLSRGLSRASRSQILAAIEALSKFEVGLVTTEEMASCSEPKEVHASVSTVAEVIGLARQLSILCERAAKAASPTALSPALSSPKVLKTPSETDASFRPVTPDSAPFRGVDQERGDHQEPAARTPSPVLPVTPDSFTNSSEAEVLKTPSETDALFRPVTPDSAPIREVDQERGDHQEPATRTPSPDKPWSSRDSSDLPVTPDSFTNSSEAEVPDMPSEFIRPVIPPVDNGSNVSQESVPMTPPFNNGSNVSQESVPVTPPFSNGSNVSQESVPMTPPLSPEKASSLACTSTSERKDGSEMAALPTTPDLSPSSSSSSCSIMIEMHVPEYKYGKLLGTGGTNVKRIQALTGAKLFLAKEYGSLEIRGTKKQCLEAQILAQQLVNEVDHLQGILCHLPYNFFSQHSIWIDSRLEDIAVQNSCKIEPLVGAYDRRNFVFICGSLRSDIECCHIALEKWAKEFMQTRSPQAESFSSRNPRVDPCSFRNPRVDPCSSKKKRVDPCSSSRPAAQKRRIQYTRDQLMSFCGGAELDLEFVPGTEELEILSGARSPTSKGNSSSTISWNHAKLWNDDRCMPESVLPDDDQTWKKKSQEDKWEHDLFEG